MFDIVIYLINFLLILSFIIFLNIFISKKIVKVKHYLLLNFVFLLFGMLSFLAVSYSYFSILKYFKSIKYPILVLLINAFYEEFFKFFALLILVRLFIKEKSSFVSFIFPLGFAFGLGFGIIETVLYKISDYKLVIIRIVSSNQIHAITSGIIAYYCFKSIKYESFFPKGFILAVLIHFVYNLSTLSKTSIYVIVLFVILALSYKTVIEFMLKDIQLKSKLEKEKNQDHL